MTQPALYPDLLSKTVLVTGGAAGIGAATVELFALQGSKVIFLDISSDLALQTIEKVVARQPEAEGRYGPPVQRPIFYHCDLTDLHALQSTTARIIQEHGPVHVLINNAAEPGKRARLASADVTAEAWEASINGNLRHIFFLTQAVLPGMKTLGSGSIVNLGSITWRIPAGDTPVYGTCKAAIMGLTRVQSKEVGEANIRINSVMPGAIATETQKRDVLTPEYRAEVFRNQSLKRDLVPMDVAKVVVFLASQEASGVTGSSYVVDGGWVGDP
ncbi:hypothetical protein BDW69DRAFT_201316 [Aspergillus filifer]